ncbi:GIY-YIG nuclease family protein [Kaistella pullorum]|uniref:GIY-YIG nuclease family protein n=1 Tax=Kaistella pullorum TaxID=2763074 RepID=A0ABR8WJI8_9FLAO|nr:GIY-YIG nuclease family protein [Kaistella pullorum]MBD8016901.1 GIY-YIG nuclease family protein [Kaistella pullorum]
MDEFVVYILYSTKYGRTYVGFTRDLISRFHSHNEFSKRGFTIKYRPWEVIHVEFFNTKGAAISREIWLKSGVGRDLIKQNVKY